MNFNTLQGPRKPLDSFVGPFILTKLVGKNAVEVILTGELVREHPLFPVSSQKKYVSTEKSTFPERNKGRPVVLISVCEPATTRKFLKIPNRKGSNRMARMPYCILSDTKQRGRP